MKLIVDTREKDKGRLTKIQDYCLTHKIDVEKVKLDVGDYAIESNPYRTVDTKKSMLEMVSNLFGQNDRKRFLREIARAENGGIELIILIEEKMCMNTIPLWKSPKDRYGHPFTNVTGRVIYNKMKFYERYYHVRFEFTHKNATPSKIMELLLTPTENEPFKELDQQIKEKQSEERKSEKVRERRDEIKRAREADRKAKTLSKQMEMATYNDNLCSRSMPWNGWCCWNILWFSSI